MNESFPVSPAHQERINTMLPYDEDMLKNDRIERSLDQPIMAKDQALEAFGINGDIIATIALPALGEAKELAIVDYGEPDPENPRAQILVDGKPMIGFGVVTERYGIRGLNYEVTTHVGVAANLPEATPITIGRDPDNAKSNQASYQLGLSPENPGNEWISRNHITVMIEDGTLTIDDHSRHHSVVRVSPREQSLEGDTVKRELIGGLGENVLGVAGVEQSVSQTDEAEASPMDKYTEDYVKEHPYDHMFDPELSDEQHAEVQKRIKGMDFRSDEQKRADAENEAREIFRRQQTEADHRYNVARQTGADDEIASASADRAHALSYKELLAEALKKAGL